MKKENIQKAYAASKSIYDDTLTQSKWWSRLYIKFFWGGVEDTCLAARVLKGIPPDFAGKLLDVPVGTGVFTAEKYKALPLADISCLDYSPDMLENARARFAAQGMKHITLLQGDVGALPFPSESFDIVLSMNGFHAFPNKEKAFAETARVLKKGGVFCGCYYIKGQSRRTDFIVRNILAKKGWFTPPFQTLEEVGETLSALYETVETGHEKAMVYFRCIK